MKRILSLFNYIVISYHYDDPRWLFQNQRQRFKCDGRLIEFGLTAVFFQVQHMVNNEGQVCECVSDCQRVSIEGIDPSRYLTSLHVGRLSDGDGGDLMRH